MFFLGNAFRQIRIVIGFVCVVAVHAQEPKPVNPLLAQARSAVEAGSFSNAEGCNLLNELATEYPRNPLYRNGAPECRAAH